MLSCGDYDANALMWEAKYKNFFVPSYLKRYINIKKAFPIHKYNPTKSEQKVNVKRGRS